VAWIVRLVKTAVDVEHRGAGIVKLNRHDDVGDIANLGLIVAERRLLLTGLQKKIVAAQVREHSVRRLDRRSLCVVCRLKEGPLRVGGVKRAAVVEVVLRMAGFLTFCFV
jgi:hypothetical protein